MGAGALTFGKIRAAAIDQAWSVERTSKGHHKLVPPDTSRDIVFTSGTPGDYRAVHNFLSQMRRSGLVWPPPAKQANPAHVGVVCVNGGVASVEAVLAGSGSSTVRRKTADSGSTRLSLINDTIEREDDSVTVISEEVRSENVNGHPVSDAPSGASRWASLWMPERFGVMQRYRLSTDGDLISETSGSAPKRSLLGHQCYVNVTNADTKKTQTTRLDKLMLWTFVGEPQHDEIETPVHINGDTWDCSLGNLKWRKASETVADAPPQRPKSMPAPAVAEEPAEVKPKPAKKSATPVVAGGEDDVSVSLTFQAAGMTLQFQPGGWSISPCENLSDDQVKAVGRMIARWERVHDGLYS